MSAPTEPLNPGESFNASPVNNFRAVNNANPLLTYTNNEPFIGRPLQRTNAFRPFGTYTLEFENTTTPNNRPLKENKNRTINGGRRRRGRSTRKYMRRRR